MRTLERFTKTANFENPGEIVTYDFVDNEALLEKYGGGDDDLVVRNAEMCKNIGLDATRFIYDPINHWMGPKIDLWAKFIGIDPSKWEVESAGGTSWIARRPFTDLQGLEKNMPSMPKKEEVKEWWLPFRNHVKEIFDEYDLVFVQAVEGAMTEAYMYTEMDLFFEATIVAPELVRELLDVFTRWGEIISELHAEYPFSPVFFQNDDICGGTGPFISPQFLQKEMVPRWKKVYAPAREAGLKCIFHTDGNTHPVMDLLVDKVGIDGFNPIDGNAGMDIRKLRNDYPRLLLFGNVDCVHILPHGSVEDVVTETKGLVRDIAPGGGLFLGSSSEVHNLVPPENAVAMYQTARKYGHYPINVK